MDEWANDWAFTFSSHKDLSDEEQAEIAGAIGAYAVGIVGKVQGQERWDYNVYSDPSKSDFTEESFKILKQKGFVVFIPSSAYEGLVSRVFSDYERSMKEFSTSR
jgi:hypothetical protein